jgi:hypothetical protein
MSLPQGLPIYQHYKGEFYVLCCKGKHTETNEEMCVYHPLNKPNDFYIRPADMFFESINESTPRFKLVGQT